MNWEEERRRRGSENPHAYNPPESHLEFLLNDALLRACFDARLEPNDVILRLVESRQALLKKCEDLMMRIPFPIVIKDER